MTDLVIPDDFPRGVDIGSISGAQPKILLRRVGDSFVSGRTPEEVAERYELCADLVEQLIPYTRRKLIAQPGRERAAYERLLAAGIRAKGWGLSDAEINWVVRMTCDRVNW